MATQRSPLIDFAIISLLILNLGATSYIALRPAEHATATAVVNKPVDVSEAQALELAEFAVRLYNGKDSAAFYEAFDGIAKAQLTQEQLATQLDQLYPVMGSVSDAAFSSATFAGSDGGRDYYQLSYKVRLTGGPFSSGDMKLTVIRRDGQLGLVGFFINSITKSGR
jgi:hypothetical protein